MSDDAVVEERSHDAWGAGSIGLLAVALAGLTGCTASSSPEPAAPPAATGVLPPSTPPPAGPPVPTAIPSGPPPAAVVSPSTPATPSPSGPDVVPACGTLGSAITRASAGAQAQAYYERTLRTRVRAWGQRAWQGPQVATAEYITSMSWLRPTVERVERPASGGARGALEALRPAESHARSVVCRAAAPGDRPQWVVSLYLQERSRPTPPDSGVWLEVFVDEASGEVQLVLHQPLG